MIKFSSSRFKCNAACTNRLKAQACVPTRILIIAEIAIITLQVLGMLVTLLQPKSHQVQM